VAAAAVGRLEGVEECVGVGVRVDVVDALDALRG
jgi:hypothetical protein